MTPWAKRRRSQPQIPGTPRTLPPSGCLPRAPPRLGPPCGPAARPSRAPCGTEALHTTAQNQPCPRGEHPIWGVGRKIRVLQSHPQNFLCPREGHLGCCRRSHTPGLPCPGAGRTVRTPQPPRPVCHHSPSLPPLLVSPQGLRSLRERMPLMAMVTVIQKLEAGRLRLRPPRLGLGCPQVRLSLDISVCSETSPLLPTRDIQAALAVAEDLGCIPPALHRPPYPPEATRG